MNRILLALLVLACACAGSPSRNPVSSANAPVAQAPAHRATPPASGRRAPGEGLAQTPLAGAVSLLGGRLSIRLPVGAEAVRELTTAPQGTGPAAPVLETRQRFSAGSKHLLLTAVELLALREGDLESGVRSDLARWTTHAAAFALHRVPGATHVEVMEAIPSEPVPTELTDLGSSLSLSAVYYVVSPDQTVQMLLLYTNAAASLDVQGVTGLGRRLAATLAPGRRELARSGMTSRFTIFRQGPELRIDAPGSIALEERGDGQETYSIRKFAALGHQGGRIEIAVTGQPEPYPRRTARIAGRLFDAVIQWRSYETDTGPELRYVHDARGDGFYLDVRLVGPTREIVDELRHDAETLLMSRACEGPGQCGPGERCSASYCRGGGAANSVASQSQGLDL